MLPGVTQLHILQMIWKKTATGNKECDANMENPILGNDKNIAETNEKNFNSLTVELYCKQTLWRIIS